MAQKFSKPAPYLVQADSNPTKAAAQQLREIFKPLMAKRLPTVYYAGFNQNFIPAYIKKHKGTHPYFLKIDISKFYPSVSHHHLGVQTQLAYRDLLGVNRVPKKFAQNFLLQYWQFINALPLHKNGIPLNSAMSKTLAPLIYVPFFYN